ncbi:MAG: enoyl-CoA hydratase-related protein [Deltaproteobacteria bacterium]|nr:enoyl-CoA hydratase-related protein [Deltaproteobacteria bacterium]
MDDGEAKLQSSVHVERKGALEIWLINRPERRNALDRATIRLLGKLAEQAACDSSLRAVIISGKGGHFSAGADLKERQQMSKEEVQELLSLYRTVFGAIDRLPVPVVAAIDGVALGGGLELALACDFRIASSSAILGLPEVTLAIIPGAGGTQRLSRLVGPSRAKELILFGKRVSGKEALEMGLINALTEENALSFAEEFVAPLLEGAPIAIAAALEAIDAAWNHSLEEGLSIERLCYERTLASEDRLEALRAFNEKRKPIYKGK